MEPVDAHVRALRFAHRLGTIPLAEASEVIAEIEQERLTPDSASVAIRVGLPVEAFEALLTLARTLPDGDAIEATDAGLLGELRDLRVRVPLPLDSQAPTVAVGEVSQATVGVPEEVQQALSRPQNRIGRYVLLSEIGAGGMGVVYRAWDPSLARIVALKMLRGDPDEVLRARFLREGRSAAGLRHPGIVAMHDVGEEDGHPYLAMELLTGRTLRHAFAALPSEGLRERVALLLSVAEAVGAAHARGIVHRDLKPENVLLDAEGRPVVTDFGLAKEVEGHGAPLTQTGAVLGTPKYMSPEQAGGDAAIGTAADVFSLGVMLYEAITRRSPFDGVSVAELLAKVIDANPLPPRRIARHVPRDIESVCLKAMEKDPARRYPDARALAADLSRWLSGEPVTARPISWARGASRLARRHRRATVTLLVAALAGVAALSVWIGRRATAEARVSSAIMRARELVYQVRQARRVSNHARMQAAAAEVERELGAAIGIDPSCRDAWLERGRMKALLGLLDDARKDLDRAVALDPQEPSVRAERGRLLAMLYRRGIERSSSVFVVDRRIAPPPDAIEASSPALRAIRVAAEADLALAQAGPASEAERDLTRAYLALVQRRWDDAISAADAVLSLDLSEEACWLYGLALLGTDDAEGALSKLDRAVEVGAGFGEAWLARAEARFRRADMRSDPRKPVEVRDDLARALEDATRAEAEGVDASMARLKRAQVLWKWGEENRARHEPSAGQYSQGLDLLERGPNRFDDVPCLYVRSALWDGLACASFKDPKQAVPAARRSVALIEEVIRRDPSFRYAFLRLGHDNIDLACALDRAGEDVEPALSAAAAAYTRSLATSGDDEWARLYRGDACWQLAWKAWKRGERRSTQALEAVGDYDEVHRLDAQCATQGEAGCLALVGLMDAAEERDPLPWMSRAEQAAERYRLREPQDEYALSGEGEMLLLLSQAQERAGKPFAESAERAGARFRAALEKAPSLAEARLGPAYVEAALARAGRKEGKPIGDRVGRAFAAIAEWRPCEGEGLGWEGEPCLALPLAQTLLDAEGGSAEGCLDLARLLACAFLKGRGVPQAGALRDDAFLAIERARKLDARAVSSLRDDALLAGLHDDPRWEGMAGASK